MRIVIIAWLIRRFIPEALSVVEASPMIAAVDSRLSLGMDLFVRMSHPGAVDNEDEDVDEEMAEIEENMVSTASPEYVKMLH